MSGKNYNLLCEGIFHNTIRLWYVVLQIWNAIELDRKSTENKCYIVLGGEAIPPQLC